MNIRIVASTIALLLGGCSDSDVATYDTEGVKTKVSIDDTVKFGPITAKFGVENTSISLESTESADGESIDFKNTFVLLEHNGILIARIQVRDESRIFEILPADKGQYRVSIGDLDADGTTDAFVYLTKDSTGNIHTSVADINLDGQNDIKVSRDVVTGEKVGSEIWFEGAWRHSVDSEDAQYVDVDGERVRVEWGPSGTYVRSNKALERTRCFLRFSGHPELTIQECRDAKTGTKDNLQIQ